MSSPLVSRCLLVVGLCVTAAACSSSSDSGVSSTTAAADTSVASTSSTPPDETTTTTSSVVEATTTSVPVAQDSISVAVYWNRPYGTARPIDIPGYKDNAGGPFPYVLYGSVTNVGQQSITQPQLTVDWYMDGQSIHTTTVPVRDAQGAPLGELAAGSSADVIVVVDSESIAPQLADAQPTFGLYTA